MKKFILLLLWSVLSFGQASNEMVSFTQAQSLGFTLKSGQSHVTSNQCMTKSDALAKYNLSASAMASYTDNQLVPRSAWITAVVSYIYFGDMTGYSTRSTACANTTSHSLYYSASSFVQSGMVLYHDSNLTIPFVGNGQYYSIYPDYEFSPAYSGTINSSGSFSNIEDCVPTPTYTQVFGKYYDPCGSQVNNLYEDSLGKYYLLVSGNYGLYSGYLYTYFGPASGNFYNWNASEYANGGFVDGYIEQSICVLN